MMKETPLIYGEYFGTLQEFVEWWNEQGIYNYEERYKVIHLNNYMDNYANCDPSNNKVEVGQMPKVDFVLQRING